MKKTRSVLEFDLSSTPCTVSTLLRMNLSTIKQKPRKFKSSQQQVNRNTICRRIPLTPSSSTPKTTQVRRWQSSVLVGVDEENDRNPPGTRKRSKNFLNNREQPWSVGLLRHYEDLDSRTRDRAQELVKCSHLT